MQPTIMWGWQRPRRRGWWQERGSRGDIQPIKVNADGVVHSKGMISVLPLSHTNTREHSERPPLNTQGSMASAASEVRKNLCYGTWAVFSNKVNPTSLLWCCRLVFFSMTFNFRVVVLELYEVFMKPNQRVERRQT